MTDNDATNKASKEFWEELYTTKVLEQPKKTDRHRVWLEPRIPPADPSEHKSCIEVGCYPGTWLTVYGDQGYELYGIDYCKQLDTMSDNLQK